MNKGPLQGRQPLFWAAASLPALLALVAIAFLAAACYYSNVLHEDALAVEHGPPRYDITVLAVSDTTVTLDAAAKDSNGDWQQDGVIGLEWPGGYVQLGRIVALDRTTQVVEREFTVLSRALAPGTAVNTDGHSFPSNPLVGRGLDFDEVTISDDLGDFPAWFIEGDSGAPWAIFLHGKGGKRQEALRILPTVRDAGFSALVITYRNDEGVPPDPSGYYRYGATEWREVEAAVQYAIDHGARGIVLYGYSMGGGVGLSFMYRSPLAPNVCGIALDAPMLDLGSTIDFRADQRGIPSLLTWAGKKLADSRFDIGFSDLDYLDQADELDVPVLLIHGELDDDISIATSRRLAALRPDLVTFEPFEDAAHVRSWNSDPVRYESLVATFLRGLPGCS